MRGGDKEMQRSAGQLAHLASKLMLALLQFAHCRRKTRAPRLSGQEALRGQAGAKLIAFHLLGFANFL